MKLNKLDWVALTLVLIGGLNWGTIMFGLNLVSLIFGKITFGEPAVYGLVGLSSLYVIFFTLKKLMAPKMM
jgi:uncharacterized membrane protein YuzA (DUF378 family)